MQLLIISILILFNDFSLFAQEDNNKSSTPYRKIHPIGISAGLGGPGSLVSFSIDGFITEKFNLELGRGSNLLLQDGPSNFIKVSYHNSFSKAPPRWSYFFGLGYAHYKLVLQWSSYGRYETNNTLYVTSGIYYVSRVGFTLKLEGGPGYKIATEYIGYDNSEKNNNGFTAYVGLKIGFHFGGKIPEERISENERLKKQRRNN